MNLKLNIFIIIICLTYPNFAFSKEIKCKINAPMGATTQDYLNKWISPINNHLIDENKIEFLNENKSKFLNQRKYIGKILKNTNEKVVWLYTFKNTLIKKPLTRANNLDRNRRKESLFFMKFELRKKNSLLFFEGKMDKTVNNRLWIEGKGKCKIIEEPKISEKELKLKAEKLAKEKAEKEAKQETELKAQILAEEKAKQETELKAQILAEEKEKLKEELRKKIRAELKEKQLAKEKAKLQAKKQAQEQARLAKEKAKQKAQKLAK